MGFPAAKILLGVPIYGRSFLNASSKDQTFEGCAGDDGTFEYKDLPRPGTRETVCEVTVSASCYGGDAGWVSYDNPQTVRMKAKFCKEKRLGVYFHVWHLEDTTDETQGLFYWHAAGDAQPGPRSLVQAGFEALHER